MRVNKGLAAGKSQALYPGLDESGDDLVANILCV
jgi:hypothetical protein